MDTSSPATRPADASRRRSRRVKTPTVLQMEAVECGAAALGSILGAHGRFVSLEELRIACGVSRDGSKASNLLRAARTYGMTAKGFKREPDALADEPLPAIVFWNFNHFVVLEGFGKDRVYLNDPASGPRVVSAAEFDESFTGVLLTFEPGPDFKKGGQRPGLLPGLIKRVRGSELALLFVVLTGLALVVPGLLIPTFSRLFVDEVLVGGMGGWLQPLLIGMALTALARAILTWLQQHALLRLEARLSLGSSSRFFWHILRLPMDFFHQRYAGEIGSRVAINDRVAQLLSGQLATTMISVLMIVFYGAVMLAYDTVLTMLGVTLVALNIVALRVVSRRRVDESQKLQRATGQLVGASMAGLQMMEDLKATGAESDFFADWSGKYANAINAGQKLGTLTAFLMSVPPLLDGINMAALLAVGGLRVMQGELTVGMLVAFQSLMASFSGPINQLVNLGSSLQDVQGDIGRLDDVLRYAPDPGISGDANEADAGGKVVKLTGRLEMKGISFGYSRLGPPLLENFNLDLSPGSRVALVGGSGSGKSTVAKLVAGLHEPWDGEVLFDGKRRSDIPRNVLVNSLALVDQDVFLFGGSIRDNLTLWDSTLTDTSVGEAGRDARIHDDIVVRPNGYDSLVGEGGGNFSGGQRQRLEIARALVSYPTLLVLDEATSALDANTEKLIDDSLRRRGCTCLIVAHRLSTIRDADEIIVLERGKVVERGTHDQLVQADGHYARLIQS